MLKNVVFCTLVKVKVLMCLPCCYLLLTVYLLSPLYCDQLIDDLVQKCIVFVKACILGCFSLDNNLTPLTERTAEGVTHLSNELLKLHHNITWQSEKEYRIGNTCQVNNLLFFSPANCNLSRSATFLRLFVFSMLAHCVHEELSTTIFSSIVWFWAPKTVLHYTNPVCDNLIPESTELNTNYLKKLLFQLEHQALNVFSLKKLAVATLQCWHSRPWSMIKYQFASSNWLWI